MQIDGHALVQLKLPLLSANALAGGGSAHHGVLPHLLVAGALEVRDVVATPPGRGAGAASRSRDSARGMAVQGRHRTPQALPGGPERRLNAPNAW